MSVQTGVHYPLRLGSLPTGWRNGYVGDFAKEIEPGFASGEHNQAGDGVAHLRPMNIDREGKIDLSVTKFVSATKDDRRLAVGDVLFNNTNSPELVGKTAAVTVAGDYAFSNHMTRIRFAEDVLPKFGALQLHFLWMRGYFKYNCVKHVNQASVSSRTLARAVPFVWAPPTEQERIVAEIDEQFSRLDEAVANLKRVKANLDRYVATTLGQAFAGRWAGTVADWRPVPLRELADVQLGQQRAPVHAADVNPIPYVRAANVTWQGLDLGDVKSMGFPNAARYRLAYGDILLAEASGSANEVGKPAIWRDEIPGACYQKTLIRIRCRPGLLNHEFAYYVFLHTALSGQFARLAPGVGILHLTAERMLVWPMVAPPLPVQASVVAEVDRRLSIVRDVEAEVDANLKRAQALRQAVLARAFDGSASTIAEEPAVAGAGLDLSATCEKQD